MEQGHEQPRDPGITDPRRPDDDQPHQPRLGYGEGEGEAPRDPREGEEIIDPPPETPPEPRDPTKFVGLDPSQSGTYAYVEMEAKKDRLILLDDIYYEHVATDKDGVWLYRTQD